VILDSSYLFDLMSGDPDASSKGTELVEDSEMQWLPAPVVAGVYYGVATARSDTTGQEVRNRLPEHPHVDVDEEIARVADELLATADDRAGGNADVGANDGCIAATADVLDGSVLTDDVDDFERLGVTVETY
jgi:predicted nucleic acid-binding protein